MLVVPPRTNPWRFAAPLGVLLGASRGRVRLVLVLPLPLLACRADPIQIDGQYGRPLPLGSGDGSPLPRLAFSDEDCPGRQQCSRSSSSSSR